MCLFSWFCTFGLQKKKFSKKVIIPMMRITMIKSCDTHIINVHVSYGCSNIFICYLKADNSHLRASNLFQYHTGLFTNTSQSTVVLAVDIHNHNKYTIIFLKIVSLILPLCTTAHKARTCWCHWPCQVWFSNTRLQNTLEKLSLNA